MQFISTKGIYFEFECISVVVEGESQAFLEIEEKGGL